MKISLGKEHERLADHTAKDGRVQLALFLFVCFSVSLLSPGSNPVFSSALLPLPFLVYNYGQLRILECSLQEVRLTLTRIRDAISPLSGLELRHHVETGRRTLNLKWQM